ncbi:hypothetical protein D3C72_1905910 [compost metagenome]
MASSAELMMASSRFSLARICSLRCCRVTALCCNAWRSASSGPWSITAHKNWGRGGPLVWGASMCAMCRSPVMWVSALMANTTSFTSLRPRSCANANASRTRLASWGRTKGIRAVSGRSPSLGWNERCAIELACTTMSCSSTTMRASGTLANRVSKRS